MGCPGELAGFLYAESGILRARACALGDFVGRSWKALAHQRRYLNYLRKRARTVPPEAAGEFSRASVAELGKIQGEQELMQKQFRVLVLGETSTGVPAFPALPTLSGERGPVV